jgi:transposase
MKTTANKTTKPKMERFTTRDFEREFPNDDACLEWLKNYLYPDGIFCQTCDKVTLHHKVASRKSYSCQYCGHHVHPTADTIYHKSSTPLRLWFYAIFLMASTRCGIAAKQLERELGVTYKTAWRMFKQIRSMLSEDNGNPLGGKVEMDETFIGGKPRYADRNRPRGSVGKTVIVGAVERDGRVRTQVIQRPDAKTLTAFVKETVKPESHVYTDEWNAYWAIKHNNYHHETVRHAAKIMRIGDAHKHNRRLLVTRQRRSQGRVSQCQS